MNYKVPIIFKIAAWVIPILVIIIALIYGICNHNWYYLFGVIAGACTNQSIMMPIIITYNNMVKQLIRQSNELSELINLMAKMDNSSKGDNNG